MYMFQSTLEQVPKNRLDLVNDLEIPDVTLTPYILSDPEVSESDSVSVSELEGGADSSDSSLALSRAMTDSEIDYGRYRRLKSRSFSDPWVQMKTALDAFPSCYLDSLNSFQDTPSETSEESSIAVEHYKYNDELKQKMQRFFDEECRVFEPDDPGLIALEEALHSMDLKDSDLDISLP